MKKLLFALQTMVRGGVEKELITILKRFDDSEYDITLLLLYAADEEIIEEIPSSVRIVNLAIDKDYYCAGLLTMAKKRVQRGRFSEAVSITAKRLLNIGMTQSNTSLDQMPAVEEHFDIAVCYHIHSPLMVKYLATKVDADRKIGWIHSDFLTSGYQVQKLMNYLNDYDQMVAVSDRVKSEFVQLCPKYRGKVDMIHNIIDFEDIQRLSKQIPQDSYFEDAQIKLLTVGRFSHEKGIDIAIEIAKNLKDEHTAFRWYLIGYGKEEPLYRDLIHQYGLEKEFIILGLKTNPYPYIANCDIYVQPSRFEAYSMTILEAKALCRPIVCFDFAGSDEQIKNEHSGYIISMNDKKSFENQLRKLILDEKDRSRLSFNLGMESQNGEDFGRIESVFNRNQS